MALLIKLVTLSLLGLIQEIYYRGAGLIGFKQIQSGDLSVLPSNNRKENVIHRILVLHYGTV